VRVGAADREEARALLEAFRGDWPNLFSLSVSGTVAARAERLAFDEGLRGYDAVQLASALTWKEGIAEDVPFATFDVTLWDAAEQHALAVFPEDLLQLLDTWNQA